MAQQSEEIGQLFASGLEDEVDAFTTDFTGKTDASSLLTVQTSVYNNGIKAGQIAWNGSAISAYAYKSGLGDNSFLYARTYVKFSSNFAFTAGFNGINILGIYDGPTEVLRLQVVCSNAAPYNILKWSAKVRVPIAATMYDAGAYGEITLNQWYCVEMYYKRDAAAGGGEFWLNGVSLGSNFTQNTNAYLCDTIYVGGYNGPHAPANGTFIYFDDVRAEATGPIGTVVLYNNVYLNTLSILSGNKNGMGNIDNTSTWNRKKFEFKENEKWQEQSLRRSRQRKRLSLRQAKNALYV